MRLLLLFILEGTLIKSGKKVLKSSSSYPYGFMHDKKSWGVEYRLFDNFKKTMSVKINIRKFLEHSHALFSLFENCESVLEPKRSIFSVHHCRRSRQPFNVSSVPHRG